MIREVVEEEDDEVGDDGIDDDIGDGEETLEDE